MNASSNHEKMPREKESTKGGLRERNPKKVENEQKQLIIAVTDRGQEGRRTMVC